MVEADIPPIPEGPIIQHVVLVDWLQRTERATFRSTSLPGHLIQIMKSGRVRQESDGRAHTLAPGLAIWYHENESVTSEVLAAPWVYYTVNFIAPTLSPPAYDQRVKVVGSRTMHCFEKLLEAWCDTSAAVPIRHARVHARLLDLLVELLPLAGTPFRMDSDTQLWWDLEAKLRKDLGQPIDLDMMQRLTYKSLRTIIRACHSAVGMSPMRRIKVLRLSMARGLVLYSGLPFTEIAKRSGYRRLQEFSRDYRKAMGLTPTDDRAGGPDYQLGKIRPELRDARRK